MALMGNDIAAAKQLLEEGEVVAIPTETVYGLAGNALNPSAVTKIFEVKERPHFDPLIIHVPSFESVSNYAMEIPVKAKILAQHFWPGPLTLLLKKKNIIPDLVTSGLDTVGLRCPDHALTRELLSSLSFPLAAPSANPFGYISPTTAQHVNDQLGKKIKYILDGGPCSVGIESTIIGFENEEPVIHRLGGLTLREIEKAAGTFKLQLNASSNPKAPGQLKSHYAPGKKLILGDLASLMKQHANERFAVLSFQKKLNIDFQKILSVKGNMNEAAQNLFAALRELDKMPVDLILAEAVPEEGLGRAINDRLKRASYEGE